MSRVSVIVPVYNPGNLLPRTLDSILAQTFADFELICIDDGSTDGSREILKGYAAKDARVKLIMQSNTGCVQARLTALASAAGEFVYFCDHDDVMHPELLAFCLRAVDEYGVDAVFIAAKNVRHVGPIDFAPTSSARIVVTDNPFAYLRPHDGFCIQLPPWGYLARKRHVEAAYATRIYRNVQFGYLVRFYSGLKRVAITDAKLYYYSCFNESMTRKPVSIAVIDDFHASLLDVADYLDSEACSSIGPVARRSIMKNLFAKNLKYQLNRIRRSKALVTRDVYAGLIDSFRRELSDLRQRGYIPWRMCNIRHSLAYIRLLFFGGRTSK